ncbi:site-specific DNA-methyltransferase [candidate division WOR-3 bacterium]|nr:site-specific DNA-methyltransferase [candidate division WOR-3 bacterium]
MSRKKKQDKKPIEQYEHKGKERINNPPVGLVTPETDKETGKKNYTFDPHIDPQLQWAGKVEHTSFEVPTVSLHVHERIDPCTIIEAVRKSDEKKYIQLSLFDSPEENPPLREAIEFYKHKHNWSNRLVAGDSLLVMNSLLEKEGMAGKVQMVYIDPPYGIKYGSNFQPFVNKRDVKDGSDNDLTQEPEMIKAFRDTWELGIHSYLTYLRDRLLLSRELLSESGSVFVQISNENVHHVRELMDEIFEKKNFVSLISFRTATGQPSNLLSSLSDYLLWYGKSVDLIKFRPLFRERSFYEKVATFGWIELPNGDCRRLTAGEKRGEEPLPKGNLFKDANITRQNETETVSKVRFAGTNYSLPRNLRYIDGTEYLQKLKRIVVVSGRLCGKRYEMDNPLVKFSDIWEDTIQGTFELTKDPKRFVVQTSPKVIQRCLLMTTDPGDLVFDPTCGSGTTAYVAEKWGRRWITCDTSRVAIALAKQRFMTALYDYYELAYPNEGVSSGFNYKTVSHITLKSIANKEPPGQEVLYDQPFIDKNRARVTGPFTVEAVPAPVVKSLIDIKEGLPVDVSIARKGESLRQSEWKDELFRTGIRAKGGQKIEFIRLETIPGTQWLHVDGETKEKEPKRIVASFGPEHAPLEQNQVELALEEARTLVPKPKLVVFAAFQFDPEASKDIDETKWPGVTLLKAQMNADLLTDDLKKERTSNESFWLMGQPDVILHKLKDGKYQVEVLGFDYYNTRTGAIESGGADRIAMWMLDVDYDGRSLYPRQVFFPMAGKNEGWARLAKSLKAEINKELIEAYRGTLSLPFEAGEHKRIAVKIVDDRGIESLKVIYLKQ